MNSKRLWKTTIAAVFLATCISGCKKDDYVEVVGVCPVVLSTSPVSGATSVPLNKVITVTFNEPVDPLTITAASFTLSGASLVTGTISYSGTTASFTPAVSLLPNTTYTGRVKTTVKDLKGNALQIEYVWTFSTGLTLAPIVISTDPDNNVAGVFLNKTVTATFNVPMDPLTITALTFIVKQGATLVPGTVTYTGTTAFFKPTLAFASNTIYTATITAAAKNIAGTALANDYVWAFTTGTTLAPIVISTDPVNNATGVLLSKVITATFGEAMNTSTLTTSTFIVKQGTTLVPGTVTCSGTIAYFTVTGNFLSGNNFTATITTGAKNLAGTPLANDFVWNFNTKATLGPLVVDLKTVAGFGIIAATGVNNLAGQSELHDMDLGLSPGLRSAITGFPPAIIVNGAMYASNDAVPVPAMLVQAKQDLTDAYVFAQAATLPAVVNVSGDLGGSTLLPGIYRSTAALSIAAGNLTLDAEGDSNAVWIFQVALDITTTGGLGGNVILIGGAQAKNIFWQSGGSASIGSLTIFKGNILALTSITLNASAAVTGRLLARNGSVILTSTNIINKP